MRLPLPPCRAIHRLLRCCMSTTGSTPHASAAVAAAGLVLRGGRVLDPAHPRGAAAADVAISADGRLAGIAAAHTADPAARARSVDVSGCFVTPGWIDLHAHVYEAATPLGVEPDATCLRRGVTTGARERWRMKSGPEAGIEG